MVAVIHSGRNIRAALNYNEQKVKEQVAACLCAENYPMDARDLTYDQKLLRLEKLSALNQRAKHKAVHISLNFDPSEKLSVDQLKAIAAEYMEQVDFGQQPYLVYQHMDSGHPHCHIVTTNIKADGTGIKLHNIGKDKSEPARKMIEEKYGLVRAEDHRQSLFLIKPVDARKLQYGNSDTRRAVYNVLCAVLKSYKYTSLAELNAVLRLYNVEAGRGEENSRTHRYNGLFYRVLDSDGEPVGVPIKASLFPDKPTLKFLESRFTINDALRQPHRARIRSAIDFALHHPRSTMQTLKKELDKRGIDTVVRQNENGIIYGITFIDHQSKCVWNGSDLGKQYSAKGLLERCYKPAAAQTKEQAETQEKNIAKSMAANPAANLNTTQQREGTQADTSLLGDLLRPEYGADYLPSHLKKKRRKKRQNNSNKL
jgi:hypothetical protein